MKKHSFKWFSRIFLMMGLVSLIAFSGCKKDSDDDDGTNPVASFQFEISPDNFLVVTFTNFSQNATSYMWDFGDGETSTEKDPVHEYADAGDYTVKLTAKNDAGKSSEFSKAIMITDPNDAYKLLTGNESKTWKLYREGISMQLGPNADDPGGWWEGLQNDGSRPCLYTQEFTFHFDGTYVFEDNGYFWGEYGVWGAIDGYENTEFYEICFEAIPENMVNAKGDDVSAWLSGTHAFTYDPSVGALTLNGLGAWIGIPKLGATSETVVPIETTSCTITITQEAGYDLMNLVFDWGEDGYWSFVYASYSDPSLEPELVEDKPPYGEDLPDLTPTEMWNTFETFESYVVLDTGMANIGASSAFNNIEFAYGVTDPAGGATNVGEYKRVGTYQELQFYMENDIQFDNFTTVSLDVYMPSSNDYSGTLTKDINIIIGEHSMTEEWWTGHVEYNVQATVMDEWVTYTFDLDSPNSGAASYNPKDRDDLDFFAISLGGGGHDAPGTFYIRNFIFE